MEKETNSGKSRTVIATHSGRFHSDDVCAVATLSLILEKDHDIEVIRTRDKEKINAADFVVDVGEIYDERTNRFDHHQEGRAGARPNGIFYSSFGLVWKKYGEQICGSKELAEEIDQKMVVPIDAQDNGIGIIKAIYPGINQYGLREITQAFRITWEEDESKLQDFFMFLVDFTKKVIVREVARAQARNKADRIIKEIYSNSKDKRLLILDKAYPWDEVVTSLPDVLLVIYPKIMDDTWGIQAGRDDLGLYKCRILFPENWAGKPGSELEEITKVSGLVYCHNSRFMAVAKTKEAAMELARLALKEAGK